MGSGGSTKVWPNSMIYIVSAHFKYATQSVKCFNLFCLWHCWIFKCNNCCVYVLTANCISFVPAFIYLLTQTAFHPTSTVHWVETMKFDKSTMSATPRIHIIRWSDCTSKIDKFYRMSSIKAHFHWIVQNVLNSQFFVRVFDISVLFQYTFDSFL